MIHVLNRSAKFEGVVFTISRKSSGCVQGDIPLHELGNPFSHLKGTTAEFRVKTRDEAVERFEPWLVQKIAERDPAVCGALNRIYLAALQGEVGLRCFCYPKKCHGEPTAKIVWEKVLAYRARELSRAVRLA